MVVDDYFPCFKGKPAFSTTHGCELWVIILEKVYAKVHGDYLRLIEGFCHTTFIDLTGAPAYKYYSR